MIKDADHDYAVFRSSFHKLIYYYFISKLENCLLNSVPIVRKLLRRILNILITINHTHCISTIWGVVFFGNFPITYLETSMLCTMYYSLIVIFCIYLN